MCAIVPKRCISIAPNCNRIHNSVRNGSKQDCYLDYENRHEKDKEHQSNRLELEPRVDPYLLRTVGIARNSEHISWV